MNRNTQDPVVEERWITPPVNIRETKDAILVEAEMPGITKDRLEVAVDNDELLIVGRRPHDAREEEALVYQEIPRCGFRRTFTLGDHINRADINATFNSGILTLRLGKAEDVKPRKVEVQFN